MALYPIVRADLKQVINSWLGFGCLPLFLEIAGSMPPPTSSSSAAMDARNLRASWPQLDDLGLDNLHPLVGDAW